MARAALLCALLILVVPGTALAAHGRAATNKPAAVPTASDPNAPVPVSLSDTPPPGRRLAPSRVLQIADRLPVTRAERARQPGSYGGVYLKGPGRWQVSYFSKQAREIAQIIIADSDGRVLEQWTGFQIAWEMARGYPGAFGRHVNALYIWLPLCALFFVPFFDWRKPMRLIHLDLLVLLSFSVSLAFFNHARIGLSTPLAYPPLVYLLARMLALTRRPRGLPARPLRLLVPPWWLAIGVVFLLGFRVGLNVVDSNVIDVGYAGVVGAQRIAADRPLYTHFPADNEHGDTYGPANYEAYVPFQQIFGWSGRWDDLPAAHAAAIVFDLLAAALLFLLGRRVRGPELGVALAYAWASYPFTAFALESNSNDALVAVLVLGALLAAARPTARGALAALAALTKFAPLALVGLLATHGPSGAELSRSGLSRSGLSRSGLSGSVRSARARALALFVVGFTLAGALACVPAFTHDSLRTVIDRTLVYQAHRESPFSIWGFYGGLDTVQAAVLGAALALAVGLEIVPRRSDLIGLAAAAAAVLIALQLAASHWFYLYIPWFFGLAMLAILGSQTGVQPSGSVGLRSRRAEAAPPATTGGLEDARKAARLVRAVGA